MSGGFSPLFHVGHEKTEADTHVESHDDVLSDAGSTPAASTTFSKEIGNSGPISRRLQHFSTRFVVVSGFSRTRPIEQPDRRLERSQCEMHVPLRCRQILVACELLDRSRRRSPHRQMRAERVTQRAYRNTTATSAPTSCGRSLVSVTCTSTAFPDAGHDTYAFADLAS